MRETRIIMGMPVTIEIADTAAGGAPSAAEEAVKSAFDYFRHVDDTFSTYKETSEISAINRGELPEEKWSEEVRTIFILSEKTKLLTAGYFDICSPGGKYDPSGIVKGWAIENAAGILKKAGFKNFYVDAGGDIQTSGLNADGKKWSVGIKNPWNESENIKVVYLSGEGIATSGTYIRGDHIYNPHTKSRANEIKSITIISESAYEADRFATAAFAMGKGSIPYIESLRDSANFLLEGLMIDNEKITMQTSGFEKYTNE